MNLTVYHLKTCDTCRKAISELKAGGHQLDLVDVRADGIPSSVLASILSAVGYKTLLNTKSATWRGLPENERQDVSSEMAMRLMTKYPTLIKRPVIVGGGEISVGWSKENQQRF